MSRIGEGKEESDDAWNATNGTTEPESSPQVRSFAPRGVLTRNPKFRRKAPDRLILDTQFPTGTVVQIHDKCSVLHFTLQDISAC